MLLSELLSSKSIQEAPSAAATSRLL